MKSSLSVAIINHCIHFSFFVEKPKESFLLKDKKLSIYFQLRVKKKEITCRHVGEYHYRGISKSINKVRITSLNQLSLFNPVKYHAGTLFLNPP